MTDTALKTRVLVIDDSAYNRRALRRMLEEEAAIEVVDTARDGEEGLKKALDLAPDVITLDLEMPKMDGFTFLRILMSRRPTPVIVVSGRAEDQNTFLAMELGAVDFVAKPQNQISPELYAIRSDLVEKIMAARSVSIDRLARLPQRPAPVPPPHVASPAERTTGRLVVVGCSTGGPTALPILLAGLPPDFGVPVVVAQHMPPGFTRAFAERLNRVCDVEISEAKDGDPLKIGTALVAPGGKHLLLRRDGAQLFAEVREGPKVSGHCPSVDVLFRTVARAMGANAVGVILTGMGADGASGLLEMHKAGATTFAQDEESCVVYGMPKAALDLGGVDETVHLWRMAGRVMRHFEEQHTMQAAR
jgi:two-component system chemotaxis response regulator CheB